MTTQFDFSSIEDLGKFWDGSANVGKSGGDHHLFNSYSSGLSNRNNNLDLLYQNLLGRNADPSGRKYWSDRIESGENTYQTVADTIKAGDEYKGQQDYLAENPDATGEDLKNLGTAHISPFHWGSGSSFAGWSPPGTPGGSKLTEEQATAAVGGYNDQTNKNVNQVIDSIFSTIGTGDNPFSVGGSMQYDDSGLRDTISGLTDKLTGLQSAFDRYKSQSEQDMQNVWNNANWGWGPTVGGVRTQNELPGWMPKTKGTSGFFGRGGRSGKGLTTSSLNI